MRNVIGYTVDEKGNFKFTHKESIDIIKAYKSLPYETQQQIDNTLSDNGTELKDMTIQYLIKEVIWSIEKMQMDIDEMSKEEAWELGLSKQIQQCKKFLKKYK